MKNLFFVFTVIFWLCSNNALALNSEETYGELTKYLYFKKGNVPETQRTEELDNIVSEIDSELSKMPNDVELLLLKGLSYCSYLYAKDDLTTDETVMYKTSCQEYLDSAIKRNKTENRLSIHQLFTVKDYSGSDIIVSVIDQILASDRYFEPRERVEYRRDKIDHLIRLNRYDDALNEMQKLNEKFPEYASAEWDNDFIAQIESAKIKNLKTSEQERNKKVPSVEKEMKSNEPQTSVAQLEPLTKATTLDAKPEQSPKIEPVSVVESDNNVMYIATGVALLLLLGGFLLLRRR